MRLLPLVLVACAAKPVVVPPDTTPPSIVSLAPADGSTVEGLSELVVTFDEALSTATITGVTGTMSVTGTTAKLVLSAQLAVGDYTASVDAADLAGNATHGSWRFTVVDHTPPTVVGTFPTDNGHATPHVIIDVTFSEKVASADFTLAGVSGTTTLSEADLSFVPAAPLPSGAYTGTVTAAKDLAGNALVAPYTFTFTVGGDLTPPALVSQFPLAGDVAMGLGAHRFTFNEPLGATGAITVTSGATGYSGVTTQTSPTTLVFTPSSLLPVGQIFTVSLPTSIKDMAGNALAAPIVTSFHTSYAHVAFVSSVTGSTDFSTWPGAGGHTGLTGADAVCQALASGRFSGTFRAWLSDSANDAWCRVNDAHGQLATGCSGATGPTNAGPWVRPDGQSAFTLDPSGRFTPPELTERGDAVYAQLLTASSDQGVRSGGTCSDYTNMGGTGITWGRDEEVIHWSDGFPDDADCSHGGWALLCLQTGPGPALSDPSSFVEAPVKHVFVTSSSGIGDLGTWAGASGATGVAAGDNVCQMLASNSHYKAWLSDDTHAMRDRISSDGPWVRVDGILVALDKADLLDGTINTGIALDELGAVHNVSPYTGTNADGTSSPLNCLGWTSSSASDEGNTGSVSFNVGAWSNTNGSYACDTTGLHFFCIED